MCNRPESAHQIDIDFVNVTDRENVLKLTCVPDESENPDTSIREEYQLDFFRSSFIGSTFEVKLVRQFDAVSEGECDVVCACAESALRG